MPVTEAKGEEEQQDPKDQSVATNQPQYGEGTGPWQHNEEQTEED